MLHFMHGFENDNIFVSNAHFQFQENIELTKFPLLVLTN